MMAATYLFQHGGVVRVTAVADASGLGVRHFERRFQADVGITPKLFARISRFQTALDAKLRMPSRSWMEIAHESGYHYQMHMLHDFRGLGGDSPNELIAQLGEGRPSALELSEAFERHI